MLVIDYHLKILVYHFVCCCKLLKLLLFTPVSVISCQFWLQLLHCFQCLMPLPTFPPSSGITSFSAEDTRIIFQYFPDHGYVITLLLFMEQQSSVTEEHHGKSVSLKAFMS